MSGLPAAVYRRIPNSRIVHLLVKKEIVVGRVFGFARFGHVSFGLDEMTSPTVHHGLYRSRFGFSTCGMNRDPVRCHPIRSLTSAASGDNSGGRTGSDDVGDSSSLQGQTSDDSEPPLASSVFSLSEEWIPPKRPLTGDQGFIRRDDLEIEETTQALEEALFMIHDDDTDEEIQQKLEQALRLEAELEEQQAKQFREEERQLRQQQQEQEQESSPVDWLQTRRKALGNDGSGDDSSLTSSSVPIREHELLTQQELTALLEFHGGVDLQVLLDNPMAPRMGGGLTEGMIVCGATNAFHLQAMTRALIDHLKARRLQDRGVFGAQMNSNQFSPRRQSTTTATNWNVVDCSNYMVHFLDEPTRDALRLEQLWSGKDPLWKLDFSNEADVDQYVADHPVPKTYGYHPQSLWDIGKLERNQFAPHNPVVSSLQKRDDRRTGRRKRRELKERRKYL